MLINVNMTNLVETIIKDKEIQQLKAEYKKAYGKNAPPFTIGEDAGIEGYKEKLKKLIKHPK